MIMSRKHLLIPIIFLLLGAGLLIIGGKNVVVKSGEEAQMSSLAKPKITLIPTIVVSNNSFFDVSITKLSYSHSLNSTSIGNAQKSFNEVEIQTETELKLETEIDFQRADYFEKNAFYNNVVGPYTQGKLRLHTEGVLTYTILGLPFSSTFTLQSTLH